jgi:hypothetical protein
MNRNRTSKVINWGGRGWLAGLVLIAVIKSAVTAVNKVEKNVANIMYFFINYANHRGEGDGMPFCCYQGIRG